MHWFHVVLSILLCAHVFVEGDKTRHGKSCNSDDMCAISANECLNFDEDDKELCSNIGYEPVYAREEVQDFFVKFKKPSLYGAFKWSVSWNLRRDSDYKIYQVGMMENCCNIPGNTSCRLRERRKNENFRIEIPYKDNRTYCYYDIGFRERLGTTEYCCSSNNATTCIENPPCMEIYRNGITMLRKKYVAISIDRESTSEYCFFQSPRKLVKNNDRVIGDLLLNVKGIRHNATARSVMINATSPSHVSCIYKTVTNLNFTKHVKDENMEQPNSSWTWCYFVRGTGFSEFTKYPTCLRTCDDCYDGGTVTNILTIVLTMAALLVLLIVVIVTCYCYRTRIKPAFPRKGETTAEIPSFTKKIFLETEPDALIRTKEIPVKVYICKEDEVDKNHSSPDRYTNMTLVKSRPSDSVTLDIETINSLEKVEKVTISMRPPEIKEKEGEKIQTDYRERLDSGLVSDITETGFQMSEKTQNPGGISPTSGYNMKTVPPLSDSGFSNGSRLSQDAPSDSGISSMGSYGGSISMSRENSEEVHNPIALRDLAKQANITSVKQAPVLAEVDERVCSEDFAPTEFEEPQPKNQFMFTDCVTESNNTGYMEKGVLCIEEPRADGALLQNTNNNKRLNALENPRFFTETNNFKNSEILSDMIPPYGEEKQIVDIADMNSKQRNSASSDDTGCGTNSYDEDDYCNKSLGCDLPSAKQLPNYVSKSNCDFYGIADQRDATETEFSKFTSSDGYTSKFGV